MSLLSPSLPLEGLAAIVTGAGRGLGRVEALELARLGAAVVVNDYGQPGRDGSGEASATPAEEVAAGIRAAGGTAVAHTGDVADHQQARELVELAISEFGKLDILVNNAGILRDRMVFSMTEGSGTPSYGSTSRGTSTRPTSPPRTGGGAPRRPEHRCTGGS